MQVSVSKLLVVVTAILDTLALGPSETTSQGSFGEFRGGRWYSS